MTITLNLSPQAERRLQELAAAAGQSLEAYVQELVEKQIMAPNGTSSEKTWQEICVRPANRVLDRRGVMPPNGGLRHDQGQAA